jgi:glutathione synthase/RimK-type ligase-like ATP-grasp enzyme
VSSLSGRRIELWVEARDGAAAINPVMRTLLSDLTAAGAAVSIRVLEYEITDPRRLLGEQRPDLVLLKTATTLALSVAVAAETHGVKFLNGAQATLRAHDKAMTVARLAAAGIPVPETFLLAPGAEGTASPAMRGAWVAKPTRGVHGRGVTFHSSFPPTLDTSASLDAGGSYVVDDGTRLLQRRVGCDEADTKVYVADGRCFAAYKRFGPSSYATNDVEMLTLDRTTEEMILAVGETLGLSCFGVDVRFGGEGAVVIDANPFPGYRGFPEAVPALRTEIECALEPACR